MLTFGKQSNIVAQTRTQSDWQRYRLTLQYGYGHPVFLIW